MSFVHRYFWLALLLASSALHAQDNDSAAGDFFDEAPQILTVSRMSKPLLESPASVSVIDRGMIESSGVRNIADLFRLVPGFIVGYHSGHAPAVSYHGLGQEFARQIQVLVDGRSVFIPSFGGVPWSNLPLLIDDIERIEVIRGPNAVTYGANAFLATINIITRHAAEDRGINYSVNVGDNANPDIKDAYLRFGQQTGILDWRLSLGAQTDDGFAAINDSRQVGKINLRMDWATDSDQLWTFQAGSSDATVGRGFPPEDPDDTDIERDEEAINRYLNLQWESISDSSTILGRITHTRQKVSDSYDPGPLTIAGIPGITTFIDFDRTSERTDLELSKTDDLNDDLRLVYGGSLRRDRVKSLFLLNSNDFQDIDTSRLFGAIEWRFKKNWLLDVGIMLEDSSLTETEASPRISLIRNFGEQHALRFVASQANRNPILWEAEGETEFIAEIPLIGTVVLPTYQGNDEVEPEEIESFEIGLRSKLENDFSSDIKLFSYRISNHIVLDNILVDTGPPFFQVPVSSSFNEEETDVRGFEAELEYEPDKRIDVHAGFSIVDAESTSDTLRESFPDYTAFVSAAYQFNQHHEISGAWYYFDDVGWIDTSHFTAVARRLDLRYLYRLTTDFRIELIGQNLLEDFEDYESENIHDQIFYLRLIGEI